MNDHSINSIIMNDVGQSPHLTDLYRRDSEVNRLIKIAVELEQENMRLCARLKEMGVDVDQERREEHVRNIFHQHVRLAEGEVWAPGLNQLGLGPQYVRRLNGMASGRVHFHRPDDPCTDECDD